LVGADLGPRAPLGNGGPPFKGLEGSDGKISLKTTYPSEPDNLSLIKLKSPTENWPLSQRSLTGQRRSLTAQPEPRLTQRASRKKPEPRLEKNSQTILMALDKKVFYDQNPIKSNILIPALTAPPALLIH
jgi:hypothetical protein